MMGMGIRENVAKVQQRGANKRITGLMCMCRCMSGSHSNHAICVSMLWYSNAMV